jgi:SAM-dependent methyltransferase
MTDSRGPNPPSPFIERWVRRLAASRRSGARALDVACGRGRHARLLAASGYDTVGIDWQLAALTALRDQAARDALPLPVVCADLTQFPLPRARFDIVVVTRYLDRGLFDDLRQALVPGGVLLYETFTEHQLRHGRGPASRAHLLAPGELRMAVRGMDVLFDEEVQEPDAVARIAARRRDGAV